MTRQQHRIGLALAVTLISGVLLLLLVGLLVRSTDRLALGLPLALGAVAVLLLVGWRAVAAHATSRRRALAREVVIHPGGPARKIATSGRRAPPRRPAR